MDELERADAAYIAAVYVGMPTAEIEGDVDYYVGEVQRMAPLKTGSADQRMGYAEANVEGDLRVARLALDMRRAGHI